MARPLKFDRPKLILYDEKTDLFSGGFMKSLRPLQRAAFTDVLDYGIFFI